MTKHVNQNLLFIASCIALTVTAMTFAIRAGILGQLNVELGLSDTELGWINAMAFLGFPVATMLGGLLYNRLGAKVMLSIAFWGHLLGLILTINADGFWLLIVSSFCIGFANGAVEAGCNPLVAQIYPNQKTTMLNRFHVWFPGGIVIGALVSKMMTDTGFSWQYQIAVMILPTLIYGYLIFIQKFPSFENENRQEQDTLHNVKSLFSPLFIFMAFCMTLTATSELGTQQWIERILGSSGASPMLIMAMITGVMALGRYFAGPLIKQLNPLGVLLYSSIVSAMGIYLMSFVTGNMIYVAALLFALGITYFWPTMIGFVAEYMPETGALGMSIMGGVGMFAVSIWNPVIGKWIDESRSQALLQTQDVAAAELIAGQTTLANLSLFPMTLIVLFLGLTLLTKIKGNLYSSKAEQSA